MSNKIEVSREQLQRFEIALGQVGLQDKFIDYDFVVSVKNELRAILAAPVVERQPVEAEMLDAFSGYARQFTFKNHPATPRMFPAGFPWFKAGYELGVMAPPELAELQATIARLTEEVKNLRNTSVKWEVFDIICKERDELKAENERLKTVNSDLLLGGEIVDKMCEEVMDERDQFKDEIDRLKGGQGDPVAYVLTRDDEVCYEADDGIVISNTPGDETNLYKWKPVYFGSSLPTKVLDEHSAFEGQLSDKLMGNRHGERFIRDSYGIYRDATVRSLWTGWQEIANLASQPAPVSVADGWKLVPIEPTEEMLKVLHDRVLISVNSRKQEASILNDKAWWKAVVDTAPACLDKAKELNK